MDTLTFLTKLIEFGAWPSAAIALVLLLRKEVLSLLPSIKKFKAGPLEFELERVVKELEETKKVAAAAEATVQVVAAKLDEREERYEGVENSSNRLNKASLPLVTDIELKVLKAMVDSRYVTRSLSGLAKDTSLSKAEVIAALSTLISKNLLEQTENVEGYRRWFTTPLGRNVANEA